MAGQPTPASAPKTSASTSALTSTTLNVARRVWATAFVRGGLFLIIGLLMFLMPDIAFGLTKWLLIILFVLQALLFAIEGARQSKDDTDGQLWRYALAVVAIAVAVGLLAWPGSTIKIVFRLVAVWALISGVLGVVAALRRYRARKPAWDWELTISLLWVVFGVMVLVKPLDDPGAVTAALSVYLTITGVVLLVSAWSLRVYKKDLGKAPDGSVLVSDDAPGPGPGAGAAGSVAGVGASASAPAELTDPESGAVSPTAPTAPLPAVRPQRAQQ